MRFGDLAALDGFGATFPEGRVTAVVGPSGCGKSTLLRVIAGLEHPVAGTVSWRGRDLADVPTHERRFGLMFQDYALFPHRTVAQNVGFGLRMAGAAPGPLAERVDELLTLVGLAGYHDRAVTSLSGGEQQRVALARTLAPEPAVLMLDEPIGSLDRELRERLLVEMRDIFAQLGLTVVYVTHDQNEAFALADQLVVMRRGVAVRRGPPEELWHDPGDVFTARFLGHDNVLSADEAAEAASQGLSIDGPALVPSDAVRLHPAGDGAGVVVASTLREGRRRTEVKVGTLRLVSVDAEVALRAGQRVAVTIAPERTVPLAP